MKKFVHCPVVGNCPHHPVDTVPYRFFLIEPFDEKKTQRETAIEKALKNVFSDNYDLSTAERKITTKALFCDICLKIQQAEICIADITGKKIGDDIVIRPNVMLELGLAYAFRKKVIIILESVDGKKEIPSDIGFIRYVDIPYEWDKLTHDLTIFLVNLPKALHIKDQIDVRKYKKEIHRTIEHLTKLIKLKENFKLIEEKQIRIIQFCFNNNRQLISILDTAENICEGMFFDIFRLDNTIEQHIGYTCVIHIQKNENISQGLVYFDSTTDEYGEQVIQNCLEDSSFIPKNLIARILKLSEQIEEANIEDIKNQIALLKTLIQF